MRQEIILTKELTRDNYYEFGNEKRIVVSNSLLNFINPNQGGSYRRFHNAIMGLTEKKDSLHLEKGRLLHLYRENAEAFSIEPETKPGPSVVDIIDLVVEKLAVTGLSLTDNIDDFQREVVDAARTLKFGGQKGYGSDVIIKKVCDEAGKAYFKHVLKARGTHMLSASTKECLTKMIEAMNADEIASRINAEPATPIEPGDIITFDENGIFVGKEFVIHFKLDGQECKALIDYLRIDKVRGLVQLRDLKTTSHPINTFMGKWELCAMLASAEKGFMQVIDHRHVPGPFQWYHIYRQFAFYQLAIEALLMHLRLTESFHFEAYVDVAETIEPFEYGPYQVTDDWLRAGKEEVANLLKLVEKYKELNKMEKQW